MGSGDSLLSDSVLCARGQLGAEGGSGSGDSCVTL